MSSKNDFRSKHFWTEGHGSVAVAILVALTIRWLLLEAYVIPSGSMLPELLINDHIFVNKLTYGIRVPFSEKWITTFNQPQRGDVIVFKYPLDKSTFFIKRLIGMPGDKIFWENGTLYINDKPVEKVPPASSVNFDWLSDEDFKSNGVDVGDRKEYYVHFTEKLPVVEGIKDHSVILHRGNYSSFGPFVVPENSYFMMGDNRDRSQDSRYWGPMPKDNIVGKAMFVWLSCEEAWHPFGLPICNPVTIRFKRFFHPVN